MHVHMNAISNEGLEVRYKHQKNGLHKHRHHIHVHAWYTCMNRCEQRQCSPTCKRLVVVE
jgi:hypothetical protein